MINTSETNDAEQITLIRIKILKNNFGVSRPLKIGTYVIQLIKDHLKFINGFMSDINLCRIGLKQTRDKDIVCARETLISRRY